MKRNLWTAGLTAALSAGILFMQPAEAKAGILPEGFSVAAAGDEALDFSGQTAEEASGKLEEYVGTMESEEISISIDGASFSSTAGELGLYWENKEELSAAIEEYSGGNLLERFARTKKLQKEPLSLTVKASLDDEKLSAFVNDSCAPYVREAKDASISRENGAFVITDEEIGLGVDFEATREALNTALNQGISDTVSVEAVVTKTEPRIHRSEYFRRTGNFQYEF